MENDGINVEDGHKDIGSFANISAEADILMQKGCFHEGIISYTKALSLRPTDKHCLVSRSKCYIQIGNPDLALADANESIKDDPKFFKGIYQKAQALYTRCDFEAALIYYHRGSKMRPEMDQFRIGIQKSREAIENSIGQPKKFHINVPVKLKTFLIDKALSKATTDNMEINRNVKKGSCFDIESARPFEYKAPVNTHLECKLLGDLYEDKLFLEELLHDDNFTSFPNEGVSELVINGLDFISSRMEFWRQQNPMLLRKIKTEKYVSKK